MRSTIDIQKDLDAAYEARRLALTHQEYTFDTGGGGKQMVKRGNLKEINETIKQLETELEKAKSSNGGIVSLGYQRRC